MSEPLSVSGGRQTKLRRWGVLALFRPEHDKPLANYGEHSVKWHIHRTVDVPGGTSPPGLQVARSAVMRGDRMQHFA